MNAEEIFHQAIEIPDPAQRATYLDQACRGDEPLRAEVQALIDAHEQAGDFLESPPQAGATLNNPGKIDGPGTVIGRYELLELIGEGGMGLVYLAEQKEPVRRRVALKIIKPGMDSKQVIARFEAERQALALLDHPNIAHVFDAGTTEAARPYFVMEYVKGMSITRYCDEHRFDIERRLKLFREVCEGVHHAHQKGVIHRDLKPSNILISAHGDRAVPKIIDFGIAKAATSTLTERTMFTFQGQLLGTPEYMSPEQVDFATQDIDTRSDIYSLGVVLYELLAGVLPFDRESLHKSGLAELQRTLRELEPASPSIRLANLGQQAKAIADRRMTHVVPLARRLHRELEWIPLKAMRKDRCRRYKSASEMADDIRNYLNGTPLLAGPETAIYRVQKFVHKHAGSVATAALVMVTLVLGLIGTTAMYLRANEMQTTAEQAREKETATRIEAEQARATAEEQQRTVEERAEEYRRLLYAHRIALADASYRNRNIERVRELLDACPEDLRGWEWNRLHYIADQASTTVRAYGDVVFTLGMSPDGTRLVSGGSDGVIKVWDIPSGKELAAWRAHKGLVCTASFHLDGKRIVSGGDDGMVVVWDATSGKELMAIEAHQGPAGAVFTRDGQWIASGSVDKTIKVWETQTGKPLMTLHGQAPLAALAASPKGNRIVSADQENVIKVWDLETGSEIMTFKGHKGIIRQVVFSPDGRCIASSSHDQTVRIWDVPTGIERMTLRGHTGYVGPVAFSPDGQRILSAGADSTITIWNAQSGDEISRLYGHRSAIWAATFTPDGKHIVSGDLEGTVKIWDVRIGREHMALGADTVGIFPIAFSPDSKRVVSGGGRIGDIVRVWDVSTGTLQMSLCGHADYVVSVAVSPDGKHIVSGGNDKTVKVWDGTTGAERMSLTGHGGALGAVAFSPDGTRILSCSWDKTLKVWDAATGAEVMTLRGHDQVVRAAVYSRDGRFIVSGSWDESVKIWDANSGNELMTLHGHAGPVQSVAVSPDGLRIASGGRDNVVKVWDMRTGEEQMTLRGHANHVMSVAFSPDGKRIISGGRFEIVKVWDAATGTEMIALPEGGFITAFSPDGQTIAACGSNGILVWESATPVSGYESRAVGMQAQGIVDELYEKCGLYSDVRNKLQTDQTLSGFTRRIALQIANARLWEDEQEKQERVKE